MSLVLHKVFKLLLQSLTGKEYATLHRTQRQIEFFGNFPILKSGHVHRKRYFIFFRQCINYAMHFF